VLADAGLHEAERRTVAAHWGVVPTGNWDGVNVLHRPRSSEADPALVERARGALLAARATRVRPARDDKQLAVWNGFALRALAHAALVLRDPRYAEATRRLVSFVELHLVRDDDRLWRTSRGGRSHTPGFAEDYFALADGLLTAHAALGDAAPLHRADALVRRALADFWDATSGTFVDVSDEHDRTVAVPRGTFDNPTPSANAMAADVLLRLALMRGDEELDRAARAVVRAVAPALDRQPSGLGRMLAAADRMLGDPIDVVVAATSVDAPDALALRGAAAQPYVPDLVLASVAAGDPHGAWPLFESKTPRGGAATAYACRGYACDEPTNDPDRLTEQVTRLAAPRTA
jgi:uncharacterized protein